MNEQTLLSLWKYEKKLHAKKWIVTVCVLVICLIDQIVGSAYGEVQAAAVNFTGFAVAGVILIHYPLRAFLLSAHYVWAVISLVGSILILTPLDSSGYVSAQWITAAINVGLYGHIAIQTFYHYYLRQKKPNIKWPIFAVWSIMMLGMVFSRNDSLWPLWFLVMFGCFYLTEYTRDEKECIFDGLMNGIIISFFLLQGFCVLYRLYDTVRYTGIFTNSNINALFYLITEAAVLGKWYRFHITGEKTIYEFFTCIMNGMLISLCLMTIGRTAFVIMLFNTALTVFFLFFADYRRKLLYAFLRLSAVFLAVFLTFPVAFWCVRYVPAHFASPLLLTGDKIKSKVAPENFSPDDEKLVSYESLMEQVLGRFANIKKDQLFQFLKSQAEESSFLNASITALASSKDSSNSKDNKPAVRGGGTSRKDPIFSDKTYITEKNARLEIYKECLRRTNFSGRKNSEGGFWLTKSHYYDHAHNVIIQMLYYFGWIPGILFGVLCFYAFFHYLFRCMTPKSANCRLIICSLLVSSFLCFGMLEIDWKIGQMSFTFFFLSLYYLFQKRRSLPPPVSDDSQ